jgi:hypothetical protein
MEKFPTPEAAARAVVSDPSPRLVGTVTRGDVAVVGHWVRAHGGDTETTTCYRDDEGWEAGDTGNGDGTCIFTAADRVTAVCWGPAPEGAVGVRFRADGREQVVPVEDGFFFVAFDDLPYREPVWTSLPSPEAGSGWGWTGYVGRPLTREELVARSGYEFPELVEWIFGAS